ncbi:MAG: phosphate:Na+ symporter [Clostridia bacterium]|nr:phosphate:Na+ symporter [Clostridia bacterium]
MEAVMMFITLLGGLGLFLYGMNLTSEALQKAAAKRIKYTLGQLTKSPFLGVIVGIIITFLLQSSSAATVLLVGFVSAGLMTLSNAMGVIMGSAIGTTLTVQLIAFKITDYALLLVAAGSVMFIFSSKRYYRNLGQVILGFGLIFYGMGVMSGSMVPLRNSEFFINLILRLTNHPIITIIASTVFTGIIQSSAATLALTMSLVSHGVVNFSTAIPIMLGANIGTTATALISSLGAGKEAKRVAVANFVFKLIGVLIILPFLKLYTNLALLTAGDVSRQIANSHTIFNVLITAIMLPFSFKFAEFLTKIMPDDKEDRVVAKFLDASSLDVPDIALWQTKNELVRLAKIIDEKMLSRIMTLMEKGDEEIINFLSGQEKMVDALYVAIANFLTGLVQRNLTEEQSEKQVMYLNISNDLEHLGDIIYGTTGLAGKVQRQNISFSNEDWQELMDMQAKIRGNLQKVIEAIAEEKPEAATEVLKKQPEIARIEKNLRFNHFMRVAENGGENIESSSVYLDFLNNLLRINQHVVSMAQATLGIV